MGYAAIAMMLIGTGVSYYGAKQQAKAVEKTAEYNAKQSRATVKADATVAADNLRRTASEHGRQVAAQRAAIAGSGLSVAGTPLAVLGETQTALDQQLADMSFESRRRSQAQQAATSMNLYEGKAQADSMKIAATAGAVSSLASTGTQTADAYGFLAPRTTT